MGCRLHLSWATFLAIYAQGIRGGTCSPMLTESRLYTCDRGRLRRVRLPLLKERALDQLVQQRADAAALLLRARDDLRDGQAVAEGDLPAGGVDRELLREIAQEERLLRRE